ncbi:Tim44-like domain protein [hydrothermal vent metagenome]|uniref:Tim44-like domain protein n=1 Tax=hydrothermal vent metagenome TaxID=652676 RepID=A0A3B0U0B9_9ZZZZ
MADFLDLPTIIIIAVAIFVLFKLRSVLGTRTGTERPPIDRIRPQVKPDNDVVVPLHAARSADGAVDDEEDDRARRKFEAELDKLVADNQPLREALVQIGQVDPNFTPKSFLNGAASAYEMIVTAFAAGDKRTLKNLLDKDVYEGFEAAINAREAEGKTIDFTFVGLPNIEYVQAELDKRIASITMRFDAEVVSATKDADGNIVEGHEEQVVNISDEWTFSRNTRSRDPNWKLVATNQIS